VSFNVSRNGAFHFPSLAVSISFCFSLPLAVANDGTLEEVLVSAQKREQNLSDVPLSISVLNADSLTVRQITNLTDLSAHVPGVQIASPNGDILPIIAMRGVSMADYNVNQASPIGVYLDEMSLTSNYTHGLALFDLERVEVLRGPQGTLYGKNTTGGAINLLSREPDFQRDGYLDLGLGNYQRQILKAAYETPLSDTLAVRFALHGEQGEGYSKNHFPGGDDLSSANRLAGRVTLKWQPDDTLSAVLRLNRAYSSPETQAVVSEGTDPGGLDRLASTYAAFGLPHYERPADFGYLDTNSNKVDHTRVATEGVILKVSKDFGPVSLTSVSGYYRGDYDHLSDADGTPQQLLETDWRGDITQWSQDVRLSHFQDQGLSWTLGLYAAGEDHQVHNTFEMFHGLAPLVPSFGPNSGFTLDQRYEQARDSAAVYGQLEYDWGANRITLGLRYTADKNKQFNVHSWQGTYAHEPVVGLIPFALPYNPDAVNDAQKLEDKEWTGTLKIDRRLSGNALVYASYSRGYRSSAFNGAAILGSAELAPVGPEFVDAYEVGVHANWAQPALSLNAAAFYYDYENQQFINILGIQQFMSSADKARSQGAELELTWVPNKALSVNLGIAVLDTEYTEGLLLSVADQVHDFTGNQLSNAPELGVNASVDYQTLWAQGEVRAHLGGAYTGQQWFTPYNGDFSYQNIGQAGHTLTNARVEYLWSAGRYALSLWGNNLSNKEYQVYATNLSEGFGFNYTIKGAPRTYGLGFRAKF